MGQIKALHTIGVRRAPSEAKALPRRDVPGSNQSIRGPSGAVRQAFRRLCPEGPRGFPEGRRGAAALKTCSAASPPTAHRFARSKDFYLQGRQAVKGEAPVL